MSREPKKRENVRVVTNEDVMKYKGLVNSYLRKSVIKNWNEATLMHGFDSVSLGNTGLTIADIRQQLYMEVVVALQNYNPDYRTAEGRSVSELTFVYRHLFNRIGQLMKRVTTKQYGYGMIQTPIEHVLHEGNDGLEIT